VTERTSRWGLRLLALACALVVWFFTSVEKRERISERVLDASVTYNLPRGAILLDPIQAVKVRLRGPDRKLRALTPFAISVALDVSGAAPGRVEEVHLAAADVQRPDEIDVVSVDPNAVPVRLDLEVSRSLPVVPRIVGEPAAGAVPGQVRSLPATAVVRGPRTLIAHLDSLATSPVSLDGHAFSFEQTVSVLPPDPLVRIVQPAAVTVQVPMHNPDESTDETPGRGRPERGPSP
jgi:YbbR domain-containing protein